MNDGRHTREPIVPLKPAEGMRFRARLTTNIEDHEEADESEPEKFPAGRWGKAKFLFWENNGWTVKGEEFAAWDPFQDEDTGYRNVAGDDVKVEYVRGPNRLEIYDAPVSCEG